MPRGRKPKTGVRRIYEVKLYLWEDEDDDLIAFLEGIPTGKRAAGIKLALRSGGALADLQSADLDDEDDDLDFDLDDFISYT
jgi:hypothetical protein